MTDLQRVQDSLRRFGFTETVGTAAGDEGGIVLSIPCKVDLRKRGGDLADRIVGGIWVSDADVRTRLVFDGDGKIAADACKFK